MSVDPVVVVGAGASGVLTATALLRSERRGVVLVERDTSWSTGPAYATTDRQHLLNVPAGKLSADPSSPCDFVDWASARLPGVTPGSFLPRRLFGEYLRESLEGVARSSSHSSLTRVSGEAVRVDHGCAKSHGPTRPVVVLRDGRSIRASHVVLALGNPASRTLAGDAPGVVEDPWSACRSELIGADDTIVIVGSGLTAVDVALTLAGRGCRGPIRMVSRHGLLPRSHAVAASKPLPVPDAWFAPTARSAIAWIRAAVAEADGDWRAVFDAIRPRTNELWNRLPERERARLCRHAVRYWEVHRHRIAPEVARSMDGLVAAGRVTLQRGSVTHVETGPNSTTRVALRDPSGTRSTLDAQWVINCTGPNFDLRSSASALFRNLLDTGVARPGPLGLGLDVCGEGSLVDSSGRPSSAISLVGPLRRGAEWETTAIPEIRCHAETLAARLAPVRHSARSRSVHDAPRLPRLIGAQ